MTENICTVFIFALGLIIGSFLNVLIYRLPREISVLKKKRSFCPNCKKKLTAKELIPLFSFLCLKGKCSKCKKRISLRYLTVELVTGIFFILTFIKLGIYDSGFAIHETIYFIYFCTIISVLIVIFFIDLEHYIIPDGLIVTGSILSILYLLIAQYVLPTLERVNVGMATRNSLVNLLFSDRFIASNPLFINHIIFAIMGVVFFGLIILITRGKGMGMGDLKFSILMGLILGGK